MTLSIILVGIEGGVNLGLILRASENFEVDDIRLVDPKLTDEDFELAEIFASKAKEKMRKINIFDNLDDSLRDLDIAFATSAKTATRTGDFRRRFITPQEAVEIATRYKGKVGIVFGRESTGLTTEEIDKCDLLIHIPTSERYRALNLSHSVAIILYEFYKYNKKPRKRGASKHIRTLLLESFKELTNYTTRNADYADRAYTAFKNILNRGVPDEREAQIVLGIFRKANNLISKYINANSRH